MSVHDYKKYFVENYKKILLDILVEQQFSHGYYIYQRCFNNNLSKFGIENINKTFSKLKKLYGKIIISVTHNQNLENFFDHVYEIKNKKIILIK